MVNCKPFPITIATLYRACKDHVQPKNACNYSLHSFAATLLGGRNKHKTTTFFFHGKLGTFCVAVGVAMCVAVGVRVSAAIGVAVGVAVGLAVGVRGVVGVAVVVAVR
ncbi:jg27022 [Pararge aegeria aegeria]|uniref:Jg27022 protein n=1 Tax=Pararge aegeria aegeria TaxID=348720 RepID=A0A8S4SKP9_9NEOP|nr:jg27022 [Pararge aegeria aegeria]